MAAQRTVSGIKLDKASVKRAEKAQSPVVSAHPTQPKSGSDEKCRCVSCKRMQPARECTRYVSDDGKASVYVCARCEKDAATNSY